MRLVNLKCPNCGAVLERKGDNVVCNACGGIFAIDYDEYDVEHEKLQTEDERDRRSFEHEKEMEQLRHKQREEAKIAEEKRKQKLKRKQDFKSGIVAIIVLCIFFGPGIILYFVMAKNGAVPSFTDIIKEAEITSRDPYAISMDNFTDDIINNMISAAHDEKISSRKNGVSDYVNGDWIDYSLESVEYDSAYLLTGIEDGENRVVIIYELTYTSDHGPKTTYDASYFDEIKLDDNNKLITDYVPETIYRSQASWHHDSYETKDQCYRENVLAFGGTLEEITLPLPEKTAEATE